MVLKLYNDAGDTLLCAVIACLHGLELCGLSLDNAEQALLLLFAKAPKLTDERCYHLTGLTKILGADRGKRTVGEFGKLALALCAIVHYERGIGNIDLLRKLVYHALFLRRKIDALLYALFDRFGGCINGHDLRLDSDAFKGKLGCVFFFHDSISFRIVNE